MSKKFVKKWEAPEKEGLSEAVYPSDPLKHKLSRAINKVSNQSHKLEVVADELAQRDRALFAKLTEAYGNHDDERARMLASELAELRKNHKFMIHSRLALEQVLLRLRTVSEVGDMVSSLSPAIEVLGEVKSGLAGMMPNVERELGDASNMLNDIIVEATQTSGFTFGFETSEEARKILEEAAAVAEQKMKDKFPPLPEASGTGWTTAQSSGK